MLVSVIKNIKAHWKKLYLHLTKLLTNFQKPWLTVLL